MPLSSRPDDPKLAELARSVWTLFPECLLCGQRIERLEDADIRIHSNRVVHRDGCPGRGASD